MGRFQKHTNPANNDLLYIIDVDGGTANKPITKVIEYGSLNTGNNDNGNVGSGESAYQIAVRLGFQGTEQQWLDSLRGQNGSLQIPTTIKTTAENNDFLILFDSNNNPYRITKSNLLAGISPSPSPTPTPTTDSLFNSVLLLLKPGLTDSSNSNRTPNIIGNPVINSNVKKYENGSIYFDDASAIEYIGNWLNFAGNYSIDFWFSTLDVNNLGTIIDFRPDNTNGNYPTIYTLEGNLYYYHSGVDRAIKVITNNTFYYVGLKRIGSITEFWVDGVLLGSFDIGIYASSSRLLIGANAFRSSAPTTFFLGHISGLRITTANRDLSIIPATSFPVG